MTDILNEFKVHYPSLKKLVDLQYVDPRVESEGKKIHFESGGYFGSKESTTDGHYVVYSDKELPGKYIGVHITKSLQEDDDSEPTISVIAIDRSRKAVANRVKYRMNACKNYEAK